MHNSYKNINTPESLLRTAETQNALYMHVRQRPAILISVLHVYVCVCRVYTGDSRLFAVLCGNHECIRVTTSALRVRPKWEGFNGHIVNKYKELHTGGSSCVCDVEYPLISLQWVVSQQERYLVYLYAYFAHIHKVYL